MEIGDIYKAGKSLRSTSSSIWRNNNMEVFSRVSREEDDEEALKWAALEKLPTYSRLRKGVLSNSKGESSEVDIHNLGPKGRKILLERLIQGAEEDNERLLLKIRSRIDR